MKSKKNDLEHLAREDILVQEPHASERVELTQGKQENALEFTHELARVSGGVTPFSQSGQGNVLKLTIT